MTDGLEYLGRARLQGLALLLLSFLVGVLAGAAGDRVLTGVRPPAARPPAERAAGGERRLPRVLEDMDLTGVQRAAIDSILASGRPRNEAIMNTVLPRLRAVGDSLHAAIRVVLTPAQAAEFDAYLRTHRAPEVRPPRDADGGEPAAGSREERPPRRDERERRPPPRRDDAPPVPGEAPRDRRPPPPPDGAPPPDGGR